MSFRENSTPIYPGHVPPKRRTSWFLPLFMAASFTLFGAYLAAMLLPTSTTVTHIDQMASACEELQ